MKVGSAGGLVQPVGWFSRWAGSADDDDDYDDGGNGDDDDDGDDDGDDRFSGFAGCCGRPLRNTNP